MRGTVAKRLRRLVYGDLSCRARKYYRHKKIYTTCIADDLRQRYQALKKAHVAGVPHDSLSVR